MKIGGVKRDGRSARWAQHREDRRTELVAAGLGAARRFGAACGLAEIAAAAGVTKPVLYRHFDDKDDLLRAVLAAVAGEVFLPAMAEALDPSLPDEELLASAVATYVDLLVRERSLYEFVQAHSGASGGDFVGSMEDALAQALVALGRFRGGAVTPLSDPGPPALTAAYGVVGMVQLAVHRWLREQDQDADELVRSLTRLVWGGLSSGPA